MSVQNDLSGISHPPHVITRKKLKNDLRIRVLVLTGNEYKKNEYKESLGDAYGINLFYRKPPEFVTDEVVQKILAEIDPSPHFILREKSRLVNELNKEQIEGVFIVENPENAPNFLCNRAKLQVWIPSWNENIFSKFQYKKYTHEVKGYIDPNRKNLRKEGVFGWDHLFVNPQTGRSNLDNIQSHWGKNSARQLVLGDFVANHLFYEKPLSLLRTTGLQPRQGVEFSKEMAVHRFMTINPHLSNPNLSLWGLEEMRELILNEGVFFKAATSRPVKNYFSPPFGGIPLTAKKSDVEETIFMMHDLNHHNIPDLLFDGNDTQEARNVYAAWRMMSEAMTLVIADMLYADTLVKTDIENGKKVDSRIYPLFQALQIERPTEQNRQKTIRSLLWANTQYAVLGDDTAWKKLLKDNEEEKLDAYKKHFEKFFVGDHVWTDANFKNMASTKENYHHWINTIGKDQFEKSNLLMLSDIMKRIQKRGADLSTLGGVVPSVFEEIFETRIFPTKTNVSKNVTLQGRLSRAFHRYMVGQMSFYSHFRDLAGMTQRAETLAKKIRETEIFDEAKREELYSQYKNDVRYVWGMGVITSATAENDMQVHPIFPPIYINYARQECKSVREVLSKLYGEKH